MSKKAKKAPKTAPTPTLVYIPAVAEESAPEATPRHPIMARIAEARVGLVAATVGGVIAFLLGGWAFGPSIGGGVQLSSQAQTCRTVKGHEVCVPSVSEDGAALVKVTADGWARYADGTRWDGGDFR